MARTDAVLVVAVALGAALVPSPAAAQERYRTPPRALADLVDAPETPAALVSPDLRTLLLAELPALPPISEVAEPELRLAGLRVNPRTGGPSRRPYVAALTLVDLGTRKSRPITGVPAAAKIADLDWAPDGKKLAFTVTDDSGVRPWMADVASGAARRLADTRLNGAAGRPCKWLPDGTALVCRTIPADRGAEPQRDPTPAGPFVLETDGKKKPVRTNPDLLRDAHDEALLDHHLLAQVARVGLDGAVAAIGKPGLIVSAGPSPDGRFLLVDTVHRPYSYRVTLYRFPHRLELWDVKGAVAKLLVDKPLADAVPVHFSAVPPGPRDHEWRGDADATVCWAAARDGGDPRVKADIRDEVDCLAAPFSAAPVKLLELPYRMGSMSWGNGRIALITETWFDNRKTRTYLVAPDAPATPARVLWDRSYEDRYADPGFPMSRSSRGHDVLLVTADGSLILDGSGASPDGDRPFVDRLNLASGKTTRLWRSEAPYYEMALSLLDDKGDRVLTRREGVAEPPQYVDRSLATRQIVQLTRFPHPTPTLAKVQKKLLRYKRADGVDLTATLYLPPGYDPKKSGPLPALLWAYPAEFKSAEHAGQVRDSPYRFARISAQGPLFALIDGFAVLESPTIPIVGEGDAEPNDSYREQLVAGARAAVEELVRLGVGDRERMAIGGHSYGAFTTANLLAHSDLFRAGIARSGAYNRTLTPFSFQLEQRNFWEAPQTYIDMSPFVHASKIDEPLLIIHGQADSNDGTFPIQSERLFEALQGLGGTARLVMLPAESHGYKARESVLHMLWEQHEWLERYVKKAGKRDSTAHR